MIKVKSTEKLLLFGMRNLMLEKKLQKIEESGIQIGHLETVKKDEVVDTELFELDIRQQAKKMADFYMLYYSLENSIRRMISETLREKHGNDWWENKTPQQVRDNVKKKQNDEKNSPISIRSEDPLAYTNFGELIDIFNANWTDFQDQLRSQKAVGQILSQFNLLRNTIAHSCELNDDEITRFKLLINDWLRIQS